MKIFYGVVPHPDFGLDNIYDGLCSVLGAENVYEYPKKDTFHGKPYAPGGYVEWPCYWNYPEKDIEDKDILDKLRSGFFDIILCGFKDNILFAEFYKNAEEIINSIVKASDNTPLYFINQGDRNEQELDIRKIQYFKNLRKYFLREMLPNIKHPRNFIPLNFSYSIKYSKYTYFKNKMEDFFWAGTVNSKFPRKPFLEYASKLTGKSFDKKWTQEEYIENLRNSKISLNFYGYGFDTVRYYEVPATGTMLLSTPSKTIILNDFEENESIVYFYSPKDFEKKLEYYLKHEDETEQIATNGYKHYLKYHTSNVRAEQLLHFIEEDLHNKLVWLNLV